MNQTTLFPAKPKPLQVLQHTQPEWFMDTRNLLDWTQHRSGLLCTHSPFYRDAQPFDPAEHINAGRVRGWRFIVWNRVFCVRLEYLHQWPTDIRAFRDALKIFDELGIDPTGAKS